MARIPVPKKLLSEGTEALAKRLSDLVKGLKKTSVKTVEAKKNIKNAEKLEKLANDILKEADKKKDLVAEEGITGAAANKIYKEILELDTTLKQDPTKRRKNTKGLRTVPQTIEEIAGGMKRIGDDPELSTADDLKSFLLPLLRKQTRDQADLEYNIGTDLYGSEPPFLNKLGVQDLRTAPSTTALGQGIISKTMKDTNISELERAMNLPNTYEGKFGNLGEASLGVDKYIKSNPKVLEKFTRKELVDRYLKSQGPEGTGVINKTLAELAGNQRINALKSQGIKGPVTELMKFPGAGKGDSAAVQTIPGVDIPINEPFRDTFDQGGNIIRAYGDRNILLQPDGSGAAIPGIRVTRPPERFGPADIEEAFNLMQKKSVNVGPLSANKKTPKYSPDQLNKIKRLLMGAPEQIVGPIKERRALPLEGDMPGNFSPNELRAAELFRKEQDLTEFNKVLQREAEQGGGSPTQLSATERDGGTGSLFSMGDSGPMPWTIKTPTDLKNLSLENKFLYAKNSETFFALIARYIKQGNTRGDAIRLAKDEMLGTISESADSARILMGNNKIFTGSGDTQVIQNRTPGMPTSLDDSSNPIEDSLSPELLEQLGKIGRKKGGKVKAKKKTKAIPKILKNRNNKGKKKLSKPLGVGAAQRGWGAVRSS